jgi:hypothetical protein
MNITGTGGCLCVSDMPLGGGCQVGDAVESAVSGTHGTREPRMS